MAEINAIVLFFAGAGVFYRCAHDSKAPHFDSVPVRCAQLFSALAALHTQITGMPMSHEVSKAHTM